MHIHCRGNAHCTVSLINMEVLYDESEVIRQKEIARCLLLVERASEGDVDGVRELLSAGVPPNVDVYNKVLYYQYKNFWSPLHHAARHGHCQVLQLLIDYGGM